MQSTTTAEEVNDAKSGKWSEVEQSLYLRSEAQFCFVAPYAN